MGWIPGSGKSPGGGHGNPLQCSCLENAMDGGACRATVHGVANSRTGLSAHVHTHTVPHTLTSTCSFLDFRRGALQGIHEQSSAQDARLRVPQAACLGSGMCVCVCARAHACVGIVFARLHTHACVVVCAETHLCPGLRPLSHPSPGPKGPHPRTLGCAAHTALNFTSAGGRPPLSHLDTSPAAPQMPGPAGSTRAPRWGQDVTSLPGDAHRPSLSGGSGQLEAWSCTCSPLGHDVTGLPGDTHSPSLSGGSGSDLSDQTPQHRAAG